MMQAEAEAPGLSQADIQINSEEVLMNQAVRVLATGLAFGAAVAAMPTAASAAQHPASMSCREFLSLDNVQRPKVVYWAEGLNHKGKPTDAAIDIVSTDQVVPMVVEQCTSAPKASFWNELEASWRRLEATVKSHL